MPQAADGPAVDPTPTGLLTFLAVARARMSSTESGAVLAKDSVSSVLCASSAAFAGSPLSTRTLDGRIPRRFSRPGRVHSERPQG